jgi:enoyl-CoA hydratase/carnithine racemase
VKRIIDESAGVAPVLLSSLAILSWEKGEAMEYRVLLCETHGPACVITLDRPEKRNAINVAMMREILVAAKAAEDNAEIRAVILYGGASFFSAGADLQEVRNVKSPSDCESYFGSWHTLTQTLEELSKPVIAAVEGFCLTGGLELALACDLRIAGKNSSFAITSSQIGTVAGAGATQRLPRIVGPAKALEMLFSAEPIDADEAHRVGLINQLVPAGEALGAAEKIAQLYKERAPLSLAYAKKAVREGLQTDLSSGLALEKRLVTAIYGTRDKQEGISAFLEKRRPVFRGE